MSSAAVTTGALIFNKFQRVPKTTFSIKSVDPDLTPRSVAFDLGLHCLPMSLFWCARHKSVNISLALPRGLSLFVCVEVLRPSQPIGFMLSAVSLLNHTFYCAGFVL